MPRPCKPSMCAIALIWAMLSTSSAIAVDAFTCVTSARIKVDDSLRQLAEATGGETLISPPGEMGSIEIGLATTFLSGQVGRPDSGPEHGPSHLLKVRRDLARSPLRESFHVDSSVSKMVLSINSDGPSRIQVLLPNQSVVTKEATTNIQIKERSAGCALLISEAVPGLWQVRADGEGSLSLDVQARSPIQFWRFDYAHEGGDAVHGGWFADQKRPVSATTSRALATIIGGDLLDPAPVFELRSASGEKQLRVPSRRYAGDFLTEPFKVPIEMTRVYAFATNAQGEVIQRMHSHTIEGTVLAEDDPVSTDAFGVTSLLMAAQLNDSKKALNLIELGADVNATTQEGDTPLMAAAAHGDNVILKKLLERGANVNALTAYNGSALFRAAVAGNTEAVRLLLERGADANVRDGSGYTALEWARKQNHEEMVRLLVPRTAPSSPAPAPAQ